MFGELDCKLQTVIRMKSIRVTSVVVEVVVVEEVVVDVVVVGAEYELSGSSKFMIHKL